MKGSMKMITIEQENECKLGHNIMKQFARQPEKFSCYICDKEVDYKYTIINEIPSVMFFQRDNRPICRKCYEQLGKFDRLITKLFRFVKSLT